MKEIWFAPLHWQYWCALQSCLSYETQFVGFLVTKPDCGDSQKLVFLVISQRICVFMRLGKRGGCFPSERQGATDNRTPTQLPVSVSPPVPVALNHLYIWILGHSAVHICKSCMSIWAFVRLPIDCQNIAGNETRNVTQFVNLEESTMLKSIVVNNKHPKLSLLS